MTREKFENEQAVIKRLFLELERLSKQYTNDKKALEVLQKIQCWATEESVFPAEFSGDRVTFDFETGEIIFDCNGQNGVHLDFNLKEKKKAIMASAGFDTVPMSELRSDINALFQSLGLNCECAEPDEVNNAEKKLF